MKIGASLISKTKIGQFADKLYQSAFTAQKNTIAEAILLIHEVARKSIQDNSDGTRATRYDPYRAVNVSKPGDPPNTDTGRLVQSIRFEFSDGGMVGRVGTNLKYGAYLEFGTRKMDARPWLSPAAREGARKVAELLKKNIDRELKR